MEYCTKCRAKLDAGALFCASCSQPVKALRPTAYTPPAPTPTPLAPAPTHTPTPPAPTQMHTPTSPSPPPQSAYQPPQPAYQQKTPQQAQQAAPAAPVPQSNAEQNKVMAVISYLHLLCLIPLLTGKYKTSEFVKYHLNQGVVFAVIMTGYIILDNILRSVIKMPVTVTVLGTSIEVMGTPGWLAAILGLVYIPLFVLCILGIVNAAKGEMKPLPVIGKFTVFATTKAQNLCF